MHAIQKQSRPQINLCRSVRMLPVGRIKSSWSCLRRCPRVSPEASRLASRPASRSQRQRSPDTGNRPQSLSMGLGYCSQPPCSCSVMLPGRSSIMQPLLLGLSAAVLSQLAMSGSPALAMEGFTSSRGQDADTYENIPGQLSSSGNEAVVRLGSLFGGPHGKEVEGCTRQCVPTCIRGGEGAPGLGPISVRRDIIVFKQGFRSRSYCLSECAQVCSLSFNGPETNKGGAGAETGSAKKLAP